jgi:hypothetical protein
MPQAQGYASYAGIGVESTLGTPVTRTKFIDFISEALKVQTQRKAWSNASEVGPRINTELGVHSEGPMEVYAMFEGLESFLKAAFGASSVASAVVSGTAYGHTYALKSAMASPGLSVEVERDAQAFLYEACQIEEVEFIQDPNDYLRIRFLFRGRDESKVSATSPSFATVLKIHHAQLTAKIATVVTTINSFRVLLKNNLTGFRPQLGSVVTKEIIRGGKRAVTGSLGIDFADTTHYDQFRALTNVALEFKYVGAAISGGGGETYQFKLNLPQVNWDGDAPVVPGPGPIAVEMPFTAFMTSRDANDELALFIENTNTSVA